MSLETLEVVRKLDYLAPDGTLIVNMEQVNPAPVETGVMKYPPDIREWVGKNVKNALFVDTSPVLKEVGTRKALNIVMLGVLSNRLEFTEEQWEKAIRSLVKEKFIDMNLKAFKMGRDLMASA